MEKEKAIDVLNNLITINNDRIEGYETASKETEEQDLKTLFTQFRATSEKCKQALVIEVTKLGGTVAEGTMLSGKFFRAWMDVKAALTGKDRKAILNSCEYGEDVAKDTYKDAIEEDSKYLNEAQLEMVTEQYELLKADHDTVKSMRNAILVD